jgi:SRSO17 transposase
VSNVGGVLVGFAVGLERGAFGAEGAAGAAVWPMGVAGDGAAYLDGLLSGVERKTGWLLAEQAGAARPYRMQSLLGRSRWEAGRLMHGVRSYVVETLGDPDGVLVVDETGFLKKGEHSVGVARQ